jgi:hypothetical protein
MISHSELKREAEATGFQPESLERAICLFEIPESLRNHPFFKERIPILGYQKSFMLKGSHAQVQSFPCNPDNARDSLLCRRG